VESGAGHVDIFCLLSFFSIKKRLGVTVTSMAVTVAVTVIVSVIMASVREFMATKNSQLNYIEDKAGNSSHKHNVFLDFGRSLESSIGSK
jgi:hypothetical protein